MADRKITQQMENWVLDVFREIPAGKAYFAHYKVKSMAVADVCASQLLRTPKIQARLKELNKQAEDATVATVLERKQILTEVARVKTSQFVDDCGVIDKSKLDSHAIQSVDEQTTIGGMATVLKLRLHNPMQAIDLLNKMEKLYGDGPVVNVDNRTLTIVVASEEAKNQTERLIAGERASEDNGNKDI